jgi:hypothetical protein
MRGGLGRQPLFGALRSGGTKAVENLLIAFIYRFWRIALHREPGLPRGQTLPWEHHDATMTPKYPFGPMPAGKHKRI